MSFEGRAWQQVPIKQQVAKVVPFLAARRLVADPPPCDTGPYVTQIVEAAGDRLKVAGDILDFDDFFVGDDQLQYDEATVDKRLRKAAGARDLLTKFRAALADVEPFTAEHLGEVDARMGRRPGRQNRRHCPCGPRGGDGQGRRLRPVRYAGHSRPRAVPSADRSSRSPRRAILVGWLGMSLGEPPAFDRRKIFPPLLEITPVVG